MRRMSRGAREFGGTKKRFLWKWNPKRGGTVMRCFGHQQFLFYFIFLLDNEEACDTVVT